MANRAKTLVKKARELEVLCDVPVCLLCFTPDGEFYSWPDDEQKLHSVLKRYQQAVSSPATRPSKKMKLDDTGSIHVTTSTGYCSDLSISNGDELLRRVESRLDQLNQRINDLQRESQVGFEQVGLGLGFDWESAELDQETQVGFEWESAELDQESQVGFEQVGFEWESAELDLELGGFWYDMDENNIILY